MYEQFLCIPTSHTKCFVRGVNTAPEKTSLSKEEVPKSVARVLNAAKVQQEWRAKQKRNSEDTSPEAGPSRKKQKKNPKNEESSGDLRIKPGESLAHFNRCVPLRFIKLCTPVEANSGELRTL